MHFPFPAAPPQNKPEGFSVVAVVAYLPTDHSSFLVPATRATSWVFSSPAATPGVLRSWWMGWWKTSNSNVFRNHQGTSNHMKCTYKNFKTLTSAKFSGLEESQFSTIGGPMDHFLVAEASSVVIHFKSKGDVYRVSGRISPWSRDSFRSSLAQRSMMVGFRDDRRFPSWCYSLVMYAKIHIAYVIVT